MWLLSACIGLRRRPPHIRPGVPDLDHIFPHAEPRGEMAAGGTPAHHRACVIPVGGGALCVQSRGRGCCGQATTVSSLRRPSLAFRSQGHCSSWCHVKPSSMLWLAPPPPPPRAPKQPVAVSLSLHGVASCSVQNNPHPLLGVGLPASRRRPSAVDCGRYSLRANGPNLGPGAAVHLSNPGEPVGSWLKAGGARENRPLQEGLAVPASVLAAARARSVTGRLVNVNVHRTSIRLLKLYQESRRYS